MYTLKTANKPTLTFKGFWNIVIIIIIIIEWYTNHKHTKIEDYNFISKQYIFSKNINRLWKQIMTTDYQDYFYLDYFIMIYSNLVHIL